MRPPKESQGALRAPLNHLLGTEANVRLLRVLSSSGKELGTAELSRRTALTYSAVSRALHGLIDAGIVVPVGAERGLRVRYRPEHPLAGALRSLFTAERERRGRILEGVRRAADSLSPPPRAVWIEGPAATDEDQTGDVLSVGLLTGSRELARVQELLRGALAEVERREDVTIEVRGRTLPDLAATPDAEIAALRSALPLLGPAPSTYLELPEESGKAPPVRTHQDLDVRARRLATGIADRILREPDLVDRAREYVQRRVEHASPGERRELEEWAHVLDTTSPGRLRRFLTSDAERATRLRQTMPFLEVLTPAERTKLLEGGEP